MQNQNMLSKREIFFLLTNIITVKMFFTYPKYIVEKCGNASWLQLILVSLIAICIFIFTSSFYIKSGYMSIIKMSEKTGGKILKIIVGILLTIVISLNLSMNFRVLPESVKTVLLPLTPLKLTIILLILGTALGALCGIYSISRIHTLFIPVFSAFFVILILLLLPYINVNNIFPIFGLGTHNILSGGIYSLNIFSDILAFYIIIPFCKNSCELSKSGINSIICASIFSVIIMFLYNIIYSYPSSEEFIFPVYQLTRLIRIGDFFQRFEAFFEFIWSIAMMLYCAFNLFILSYIWSEAFDLKYSKQLVFPFALIIGSISFIPVSTDNFASISRLINIISVPFCFLLPFIIPLFYRIKLKFQKNGE